MFILQHQFFGALALWTKATIEIDVHYCYYYYHDYYYNLDSDSAFRSDIDNISRVGHSDAWIIARIHNTNATFTSADVW